MATTTVTHTFDPSGDPVPTNNQNTGGGWRRFIHFQWVRRPGGMLKLAQGVIVLLAMIIMGSVGGVVGTAVSSINFFNFVYPTTFINLIIDYVLFILHFYHRVLHYLTCNIVRGIFCGIVSFLMLISSIVVISKWPGHSTIAAAGVFGLIACVLFVLETLFYVNKWRANGKWAVDGVQAIVGVSVDHQTGAETSSVPV